MKIFVLFFLLSSTALAHANVADEYTAIELHHIQRLTQENTINQFQDRVIGPALGRLSEKQINEHINGLKHVIFNLHEVLSTDSPLFKVNSSNDEVVIADLKLRESLESWRSTSFLDHRQASKEPLRALFYFFYRYPELLRVKNDFIVHRSPMPDSIQESLMSLMEAVDALTKVHFVTERTAATLPKSYMMSHGSADALVSMQRAYGLYAVYSLVMADQEAVDSGQAHSQARLFADVLRQIRARVILTKGDVLNERITHQRDTERALLAFIHSWLQTNEKAFTNTLGGSGYAFERLSENLQLKPQTSGSLRKHVSGQLALLGLTSVLWILNQQDPWHAVAGVWAPVAVLLAGTTEAIPRGARALRSRFSLIANNDLPSGEERSLCRLLLTEPKRH